MGPSPRALQTQPFGQTAMTNMGRLLLVDDDPQIRGALRMTLTSAGYMVVEASSGDEALDKVNSQSPVDVVLLDLKMPGMSGLEACQGIRELVDVPILVISALRDREDKLQASGAGADDYLVKPFGIQELLSRIRALRRATGALGSIPIS
jgi:DNA-binding response OmpR family regulator